MRESGELHSLVVKSYLAERVDAEVLFDHQDLGALGDQLRVVYGRRDRDASGAARLGMAQLEGKRSCRLKKKVPDKSFDGYPMVALDCRPT